MHLLYHSCFQISNEKKITSDFIILFLVYCLNSIYIFFFPRIRYDDDGQIAWQDWFVNDEEIRMLFVYLSTEDLEYLH